MDVERTFRQVHKPEEFPCEEPDEAAAKRLFPVAPEDINSFPREDSPYARALDLDDIDALDRARADEAVAAVPTLRVIALPKPRERQSAGMALPIVAVLALAGWGAFLWERIQPITLPDAVRSSPPPAVAESNPAAPERPLPARPLAAVAPLSVVRPAPTAAPSPPAFPPLELVRPTPAPAPSPPAVVPAATNVSGSWMLTRAVESSSYNAFTGMTFGYEVRLQQRGGRITGSGIRVSENGSGLAKESQVPVQLQGTIAGGKLILNFTEGTGSRRRSGQFLLVIEEPGVLRGRFSSNAASSKGTAEAQRSTG